MKPKFFPNMAITESGIHRKGNGEWAILVLEILKFSIKFETR